VSSDTNFSICDTLNLKSPNVAEATVKVKVNYTQVSLLLIN